jgi:hypothetical protein
VITKNLSALVAAATFAIATSAGPTTADARCVGCAVGPGERPADAPSGYVYYPYGEPLPGPNCLVPRAGLRHLRQHGRLARASGGLLLLASRLSSMATALTAHRPLDPHHGRSGPIRALAITVASQGRSNGHSITCTRIMLTSMSSQSTPPITCGARRKRAIRTKHPAPRRRLMQR